MPGLRRLPPPTAPPAPTSSSKHAARRRGHGGLLLEVHRRGDRRVVIALIGVNRGPGGSWATVGLAGHPNGFLRTVAHPEAFADPTRLGAHAGDAFHGVEQRIQVDLGPGARLDVNVDDPVPGRAGGTGAPACSRRPGTQPVLAPMAAGRDGPRHRDARRRGVGPRRRLGLRREELGQGGFPDSWWWGQAQGFAEPEVVAFAGAGARGATAHDGHRGRRTPARRHLGPTGQPRHLTGAGSGHRRGLGAARPVGQLDRGGRGHSPLAAAHVLPVPLPAERRNIPGAIEHLGGSMRVTVRRRGRLVWRGESSLAALEHGGVDRARPRWPGAVTAPVRRTPRQ